MKYKYNHLERRRKLLELTIESKKEILSIYREASEEVLRKLKTVKSKSMNERYLKELYKSIEEYKKRLNVDIENSIRNSALKAADLGLDQSKDYFENMDIPLSIKKNFSSMFTNISDDVLRILVDGDLYKDGKTLSKRIWDITKRNGKSIDNVIKIAIAEQKSANELAKDLEKYIKKDIGKKQKTRVTGIDRDISYQAIRLARTSINHCFIEANVQEAMDNPFNIGLKWNLSSQHSNRLAKFGVRRDICDEYAEQNNYGLGKGIFPPKYYPKGHPNCLCYSIEIMIDIDEAREEVIRWINGGQNRKIDLWAKRHGFSR